MLRGLLPVTLERIESLRNFYTIELEPIKKKALKGRQINSFGFTLDTYLRILSGGSDAEKQTESFINMQENLKKHIDVVDQCEQDGTKKIMYRLINPDALKQKGFEVDPTIASRRYRQFSEMPVIHSANTLIMLITRFEEFVAELLSQIYFMFPQQYLDNQQVKFSDIVGIGIDEVRSNIIDREIDYIMRKSYEEWFTIFSKHGMSFKACESEMLGLKEVYARRNIIVHNSGAVNSSYKKMVPHSTAKIGEYLISDSEYVNSAFSFVTTVIYTISIEAARLLGKNSEDYLIEIFNEAFEELQKKNYRVCANVFSQLSTNRGLDASTQLMSRVNNWISRIELGEKKDVQKEVEQLDVSALSREYLLAKLILLEQYDRAIGVLEQLYTSDRLSSHELETWPLFMHFRETDIYAQFKQKHAKDFEVSAVEVDQKPSNEDAANAKSISTSIECPEEMGNEATNV